MATQYTGLTFKVPSAVDIDKFRYDLIIKYRSGEATYQRTTGTKTQKYTNQNFNGQFKTLERQLPKGSIEQINYLIKVNGKLVKNISATPNKSKGVFREYELKTTIAGTRKDPNTIKKVFVDTTEVGWIIIEKDESIKSFLKKIYRETPTLKEENIFRENNAHLKGNPVLTLQAGDFVILSNTSNAKNEELAKMKKDAKTAKTEFEKVKKEFGLNSERFATNIDFLHDLLINSEYVALTGNNSIQNEQPSNSVNYAAISAGTSQGIITFNEVSNKKVTEAYAKIVEAMQYEKLKKSKFANPKNFKLFKKKYSTLFKNFDNSFSQSYFKFNFGVQTDKLRQQIKKNVYVRPSNYKGGINAYAENFRNMGKVDKLTKVGGNLLVAVSVADATMNINEAYVTGNSDHTQKTIIKETLKLEGSLGGAGLASGGVMLAATIFGVGTGGVGFIVIGVIAAGAGVVGGYYGGKGGAELADLIYQ